MTAQHLRFVVPLCTVIALTCACSRPAADTTSTTSANAIEQTVNKAEKASAAANGGDALEPNELLEGTIQLDVGNGAAAYRSIATKIADDLGKTAAARMDTAAGKKDLASANAKVGGGRTNVSAKDVQDIANAFAGKTIYTSQMRTFGIVNQRQVELTGVAADGRKTSLYINFPMDSDTPIKANLEYWPTDKKRGEWFEADGDDVGSVQVTLDRFERVDDRTLSMAGSFKTGKLMPSSSSDELTGQEIKSASGSFDFTHVNIIPEK